MSAMGNRKRRHDILVLLSLVEDSREILKDKRYFALRMNGPHMFVDALGTQHVAAIPDPAERDKDMRQLHKVVNAIKPVGYSSWRPDVRLWFASQIVKRLIGVWTLPQDETQLKFVQSLYDVSMSLAPDPAPAPQVEIAAVQAVEQLRAKGQY